MLSDKAYFWLSERAYWVDGKKGVLAQQMKEGQTYFYDPNNLDEEAFCVLKIVDDTETGMQALAIAPVDDHGIADMSRVVISYAGTNMNDVKDQRADVMEVILGVKGAQIQKAMAFYHTMRQSYPQATIATTGHSLGGFLAQYVAIEQQLESTVYNAPDPYRLLSDRAKAYIAMHQAYHINYRHRQDIIGNFGPDSTETQVYVNGNPWWRNQEDDLLTKGLFGPHLLATWKSYFNISGQLVDQFAELGKHRKSRWDKYKVIGDSSVHRVNYTTTQIRLSPRQLLQLGHDLRRIAQDSQRVFQRIDHIVGRVSQSQQGEAIRTFAQSYRHTKKHFVQLVALIDELATHAIQVSEQFVRIDTQGAMSVGR